MRCRILHESRGRMRVHLYCRRMTMDQADLLEAFLGSVPYVRQVRADERTCNAVILYRDECREKLLRLLASFEFRKAGEQVAVPEHSSRALNRAYEEKMVLYIARRAISRFVLPAPLRALVAMGKAVPYMGRALHSLAKGKLEVSVLDAASIGVSMLHREWDTAGSIMFLLGIGDIMEEWTHRKSVEDLAGAMSLNVEKVWTRTPEGQEILARVDQMKEGDIILLRTGHMIPLDAKVLTGEGAVNQSSITGESMPVHKGPGSLVYAGTVVEEGEMSAVVLQSQGTGRYDRIVKMIEESEKLKSASEDKAFHLADRLVPWTIGGALLTWGITGNAARAAAILMVDFCCALKLSMPIAVLSAMREASEHHISVKGGKYLENYEEAATIAFDKTGTLTEATPSVRGVVPFNGTDPDEMLRLAACLEEHYPHSMANAVVEEARKRHLEHEEKHSRVEYIVAHGIASSIDGLKVRIGSRHFIFEDEGVVIQEGEEEKFRNLPDEYSHLYLSIDNILSAVILIEDPIKKEAVEVIRSLHALGLQRVVMLTGDSERTARAVAGKLGVDDYYAEVLPDEKAAFIRREHEAGRKVIMVGDGVNDSPALSESDCGVAVNSGAAIAREIADITITEDDLHSLVVLRQLSSGLMHRIHSNYRRIILINTLLMILGGAGVLPSAATALLHNASTILISLESMKKIVRQR